MPRLIDAMQWDSTIYSYGWMSGETVTLPTRAHLSHLLAIKGWAIVDTLLDPAKLAAAVDFIGQGVASGKLTPVIDRLFAFDEIVAAHRHLEASHQFGKIVVTV